MNETSSIRSSEPATESGAASRRVAVVMTVRNDGAGCTQTLDSLARQSRLADEIIVVDGGSTDPTPDAVLQMAASNSRIRLLEAAAANIAQGRNIGIRTTDCEIIATIDAGCRADPHWLENLTKPFAIEPDVEFVAGVYVVDGRNLFETVVGLATMRGQLEPFDPATFNPSARSMAFTKEAWRKAGGFPEWLRYSEDTLFDHKMRQLNVAWRFVGDAVVHWRPRSTVGAVARQFFHYGTGRGQTQIGAVDFAYNLRNLLLLAACLGGCFLTPVAAIPLVLFFLYFYVWTFHRKARRIARRTNRKSAYLICLVVMWIVLFANLAGYLVGSWQRYRYQSRYIQRHQEYLTATR